jgi:hypothetical protein
LVDIEVIDRHSELSKIISECYKSSIEVPTFGAEYLIEIKPVVSDDFPAVLRQMKLSKAKIYGDWSYKRGVCKLFQNSRYKSCISIGC